MIFDRFLADSVVDPLNFADIFAATEYFEIIPISKNKLCFDDL